MVVRLAIERAPDEPTPMEKRQSVHPVVQFSVAVSQQLFAVLGYLYPLLDYEHRIPYKSETAGGDWKLVIGMVRIAV
jgi:hypothetical protein